jgi:hypothetical protein
MIKLLTKNIVGPSSQNIWVQAQTADYDTAHKLVVLLQLKSDDEDSMVDLSVLGSEILLNIEQKSRHIENEAQLKNILATAISGLSEGVRCEYLVGNIKDSSVMLCGKGEMTALIVRDSKIAKIGFDINEEKITTGFIKDGDLLLFATAKMIEVVGPEKLKKILTEDPEPGEALAPLIHLADDTSGVAGAICEVQEEDEQAPLDKPNSLKIYLRNEEPRKLNMWVGLSLLLLLSIMIGVGMVRRVKVLSETAFQKVNTEVAAKIAETLSIGDLNPERARVLLAEARVGVETYIATKPKEEYRVKALKLNEDISKTEEQAFKKNDIALNTIVELEVLVEGLQSNKMKTDGKGNLVFIDESNPRLVSMNISDRSRQIIDTKNDGKFLDVSMTDTKYFGLNAKSVTELNIKKEETKTAIEADEFWVDPVKIGMFAGNIYILDKGQSEIWKYPTLGDTFGGRRRWLAAGITPDLANVVDMKVVGDIWLLTSTGKLERYSRGAPVKFSMDGFPSKTSDKKLAEPSSLWVTESLIYVLENGASRITVFGDDGLYKSQYVNSEFSKASDLVIVDDKGYVLIDNVVKEFSL